MRKAILTKFIHLLFLALVLNTFIALVVTSSVLLKRSREDMHFALESVDRMLDYTGNVEEQLMDLSDLTNDNNSRYTLIRMDGTVVADTEVAQVNQMENHLERKEVKDAHFLLQYGIGVRNGHPLFSGMIPVTRSCFWRSGIPACWLSRYLSHPIKG